MTTQENIELQTSEGQPRAKISNDNEGIFEAIQLDGARTMFVSQGVVTHNASNTGRGLFALAAKDVIIQDSTETTGATLVDVQLGAAQTAKSVVLKTNGRVQMPLTTPSSSSESGEPGTIAVDGDYIYVCNASGVWKRSALSSF